MATNKYTDKEKEKFQEVIGIAVGRASMCWEDIDKAGIFESERAIKIISDLMIDLGFQDEVEEDA